MYINHNTVLNTSKIYNKLTNLNLSELKMAVEVLNYVSCC